MTGEEIDRILKESEETVRASQKKFNKSINRMKEIERNMLEIL
tara:strand:+ start:121 stop:249 length:129 start_codon:yes stop_codon:yes gene_type:complete